MSGCGLCRWAFKHSSHLSITSSNSLARPGHQIDCLANSRHLAIPSRPLCILLSNSFLSGGGMMIRPPLSKRLFSTVNSAETEKYGFTSSGKALLLGQPDLQNSLICWQTPSALWHSLISVSRHSLAGKCSITKST